MTQIKIPDILPPEIRGLLALQIARENRCPLPGAPVFPMRSQEPAPGAPRADDAAQTEPSTSNADPASKETEATGRESNGRHAKGNRGGPGNPFARQVAAFRACLVNCVTQDDFTLIVYRLVERAQYGNLQAIKLLFSYLLGTPKPVVEPDELDPNEMHLAHQEALAEQALQETAPARPAANDAPAPPDDLDQRPATSLPEMPPSSAPSTNRTNGEACPPTTDEAPSTNRVSEVFEARKPVLPPSTNRRNGEPAAGASKTRPSTNRSKRAGEPSAGGGLPHGQPADADEKQT